MSPRALANQRRFEQWQRMGRFGRSMAMFLAIGLSVATLAIVVLDQMYRPDSFAIDNLKIVGSFNHLEPQQIEAVVIQQKQGNFFSIDLDQIKHAIEQIDWVQQADVRRQWPDTLLVAISEQRPLMRWQNNKWVNSNGEVVDLEFPLADDTIGLFGPERDSKLMLHTAARWQKQLADFGIELKSLRLSASQSYSVKARIQGADSEFDLMLGSEHVEARLARFLSLYDTQLRFTVRNLKRVDARYPNGLAVDAQEIEQALSLLDSSSVVSAAALRLSTQKGDKQ